jgi:uncharacterized protein
MILEPPLIAALAAALVAGLVRGFAGFGAALIFMPVVAAAIEPRVAAPILLIMDSVLTLPMVYRAVRTCHWRTVLPAALAAMATAPLGAAILTHANPAPLRWGLSGLVLAMLLLLASGMRYSGEPHTAASAAVGGSAGILGGIAQVSGPPMIAFWVAGPFVPAVIRANMMTFFAFTGASTILAYAWNGLFTRELLWMVALFGPLYAIALFLGARLFGRAPDRYYRRIAYVIIAVAAVTSVPALDGILR